MIINGKEFKIIAIIGNKSSGKSTLANYIKNEYSNLFIKHQIYSLASKPKEIVNTYFDVPKNAVYGNETDKNLPTKYVVNGEHLTVRKLTQFVATEIFRDTFGENFWTELCIKDINLCFSTYNNFITCIIDDVRMQSEVNDLYEAYRNDIFFIKLTRSIYSDNHRSESEVKNIKIPDNHVVIDNAELTIREKEKMFDKIVGK